MMKLDSKTGREKKKKRGGVRHKPLSTHINFKGREIA